MGSTQTSSTPLMPPLSTARPGRFRWVICGLLFYATTVNYIDRGVFGVLAPSLQKDMGWSATQFGYINAAFTFAYAIGFIFVGRMIDRIGTRLGYALSLAFWGLSAAGHALARTPLGFGIARFCLGLGESGNFPAAIKTTAEWFPRRERALATGIFNAGSNVGAIVAPLAVPFIVARWSWQWAFVMTGLAEAVWLVLWLTLYRKPAEHPLVGEAELAYIQEGEEPQGKPVPWRKLFPHRQTWAFAVGKFMTDPIWYFYMFWSAMFFTDKFKINLKEIGLPLVTIYLMADFGSIFGGWLSSFLLKKGWSANAARKTTMLVCALCVLPVVAAPIVSNMWLAVFFIGMAAAAHQGYSANLFTLTSDMFPRNAVASVVGIGGMAGAIAGILMNLGAGRVKDLTGSYLVMFIIAGSVYLIALLMVHLLAPRLTPVQLKGDNQL